MTAITLNSNEELHHFQNMRFSENDVLSTEREKIKRKAHLLKAVVLESMNQTEVIITVEDQNSCKKVKSRVIATGDDRILLEKGLIIPINCIKEVEFPQ